jgi:hypothetical protein
MITETELRDNGFMQDIGVYANKNWYRHIDYYDYIFVIENGICCSIKNSDYESIEVRCSNILGMLQFITEMAIKD